MAFFSKYFNWQYYLKFNKEKIDLDLIFSNTYLSFIYGHSFFSKFKEVIK